MTRLVVLAALCLVVAVVFLVAASEPLDEDRTLEFEDES